MKKHIPHLLLILSLTACFTSCKKKLPEDDNSTNPEFYFKCDINGFPINLKAGVNNYYMYSLHEQNVDSVYVYRGDLKQKDCNTGCEYGVSIQINDFKISTKGASMKPDSGLFVGDYQFNDGVLNPLFYNAYFIPLTNSSANTYQWRFSDGTTQYTNQAYKLFKTNTTQSVALLFTQSQQACSTTHTNVFTIGNELQTNISAFRNPDLQSLEYTFTSNSTSTLPVTYYWEFGDGASSTLTNPTHIYANQTTFRPKLTLSSGSITCVSYYQAPCFTYTVCNANYNAYFTPLPNPKALSAITIKVIDPNGIEYSSSTLNQPNSNKFEIISVEEYKLNERTENTKKLKLKFNCTLQSGSNTISVNNGEAVIAVSYK